MERIISFLFNPNILYSSEKAYKNKYTPVEDIVKIYCKNGYKK